MSRQPVRRYADRDVDLDAEEFFSEMLRLLAESLEETVGLEDSASFVAAVGGRMGSRISDSYGAVAEPGDREDVAEDIAQICVDLKARIGGGFAIDKIEGNTITFVNTRCPFGPKVEGRPSLCMMTTNVFGRVAAARAGYAAVHIEKSIAAGDAGCRVVVTLERDVDTNGHEFYG